jgi:hypothetical protein
VRWAGGSSGPTMGVSREWKKLVDNVIDHRMRIWLRQGEWWLNNCDRVATIGYLEIRVGVVIRIHPTHPLISPIFFVCSIMMYFYWIMSGWVG